MKSGRTRLPSGFVGFRADLGEIIGRARREHFGKQQALADAIGITRESLSRIERGRSWPRPDTLDGLLRELELDWGEIAVAGITDRSPRPFDGSWRGEWLLELGRAVRAGRQRENLSLRVLATRCQMSIAQLSRIERGEMSRSRVYEDHPDDAAQATEYRRIRFRDQELRRLARLVG